MVQAGPQSEVFNCTKFSMKVQTESKCTYIFLLHNILCNRITNDSLELILVMEKMQWGRLQEKLQEG